MQLKPPERSKTWHRKKIFPGLLKRWPRSSGRSRNFSCPLKAQECRRSEPDATVSAETVSRPCPGNVLVAEDDPIYRRVLQSQLVKWGYQVITAENGLAAWEALQSGDAPQMAILDWIMPGLDGIEQCRKIRANQHGAYLYVLLLTAKHNKEDVVAGLEAGADDYLTKPLNSDELRAGARGI
jgi:CheY-like chemotaxis protein